jgi:hypothetical protein
VVKAREVVRLIDAGFWFSIACGAVMGVHVKDGDGVFRGCMNNFGV